MIKSFKHKGLKKFYLTGSTAGIQADHQTKIEMILSVQDSAESIQDMNFPAFRLDRLSGNRSDIWSVWSIWIYGNWRLTFRFGEGNAEIINYEDCH